MLTIDYPYDSTNYVTDRNILTLTHLPLDKMVAILAEDIFKRIFVNKNVRIFIQISLKFVPNGPIDNKPSLSGNGLVPNRREAIT